MSEFFLRSRWIGRSLLQHRFFSCAHSPIETDFISAEQLGRSLTDCQQLADVASIYRQLLLRAHFNRQPSPMFACCKVLARFYERQQQTELAEHYRRRAQLTKTAVPDGIQCDDADAPLFPSPVDTAELNEATNDALSVGDLVLAEDLLWRSLQAEIQHGMPAEQADDLAGLGVVAVLRQQWDLAFELLWQACDLHHLAGDERGTGSDLMNLSQAYLQTGQARTARWALEQAMSFLATDDEAAETLAQSTELLRELSATHAVTLPWPVEAN